MPYRDLTGKNGKVVWLVAWISLSAILGIIFFSAGLTSAIVKKVAYAGDAEVRVTHKVISGNWVAFQSPSPSSASEKQLFHYMDAWLEERNLEVRRCVIAAPFRNTGGRVKRIIISTKKKHEH